MNAEIAEVEYAKSPMKAATFRTQASASIAAYRAREINPRLGYWVTEYPTGYPDIRVWLVEVHDLVNQSVDVILGFLTKRF